MVRITKKLFQIRKAICGVRLSMKTSVSLARANIENVAKNGRIEMINMGLAACFWILPLLAELVLTL
jgi:hypothetical protein